MELLELDRDSFHNAISTSSLDVFLDQQLDQLISLSEHAHVCLCLIILRRTQRRRPDVDSNAEAAEVRLNAASLWLTQHVAEHPHPSRRLIMLVEEATKLSKAGWWLNENDDKDDDDDDEVDGDEEPAAESQAAKKARLAKLISSTVWSLAWTALSIICSFSQNSTGWACVKSNGPRRRQRPGWVGCF